MPIMVMEEQQALRDARGRMLAPLPGAAPAITSDNARSMVQKRIEKYRLKTNKRIIEKIGAATAIQIENASEAFAEIAAMQAMTLYNAKDPKLADVVKLRQLMTGESPEGSRRANEAPAGAIVAQPAALVELVQLLEQDRRAEVARATAIDGDSHA